MDNTIKVIIRFKAFQDKEEEQSSNWTIEDREIIHKNNKQENIFEFDTIMAPNTLQEDLFDQIVLPKVEFFNQGYNGAVFAYGATSSGKTYTILGPESTVNMLVNAQDKFSLDSDAGILPRSFLHIIEGYNVIKYSEGVSRVQLKVTYVEIYNEAIYDLLNPQMKKDKEQRAELKMHHQVEGVKLMGVKEVSVDSVTDLFDQIAEGTKNRSVGVTQFNSRSSRSHVIFTIEMIVEWNDKSVRTSKIQFIDLAGSERLAKSASNTQVLEETKKINQSLSCLGFCIMALSSRKTKHVPYRDSKLTAMLKECLGGNSNTSFICAVSAAPEHDDKTLQTLKFAQRAKKIVNKVRLNLKLSYEQIEKQLNSLKHEMGQMEGLLLMHGIKYDRQFVKDELAKYQMQQQPEINIQTLTEQYRKSMRKTISKQDQADIKNEFRQKFQRYMEQTNCSSVDQPSSRSIKQNSLPCSLQLSARLSDGEHELEISRQLSQEDYPLDDVMLVEKLPTNRSTTFARKLMMDSLQEQPNQDEQQIPRKRDSCCTLM